MVLWLLSHLIYGQVLSFMFPTKIYHIHDKYPHVFPLDCEFTENKIPYTNMRKKVLGIYSIFRLYMEMQDVTCEFQKTQ